MRLFREAMTNVLQDTYRLPEEEAQQCLASYWPDFFREHLELRMVDSRGYLIQERVISCPDEEFDPVFDVVYHLLEQWLRRRKHDYPNGRSLPPNSPRSMKAEQANEHDSVWDDPFWFPEQDAPEP